MKSLSRKIVWMLSLVSAFSAMLGLTSKNVHAADPAEVARNAKDGNGTPCSRCA